MRTTTDYDRRYPCSVCANWHIRAAYPECDIKARPLACVHCLEQIRRENEEAETDALFSHFDTWPPAENQ